jgi:hypothetical protein
MDENEPDEQDIALQAEARAIAQNISDEAEATNAISGLVRSREFLVMRRMALSINYMIAQYPKHADNWAEQLVKQLTESLEQVAGNEAEMEEI